MPIKSAVYEGMKVTHDRDAKKMVYTISKISGLNVWFSWDGGSGTPYGDRLSYLVENHSLYEEPKPDVPKPMPKVGETYTDVTQKLEAKVVAVSERTGKICMQEEPSGTLRIVYKVIFHQHYTKTRKTTKVWVCSYYRNTDSTYVRYAVRNPEDFKKPMWRYYTLVDSKEVILFIE